MCPLFRSRRGRQPTQRATSTFALCVFEAWYVRRPDSGTRGPLPHHDNAGVHTAAATPDYLAANLVQLVTQTLYSPAGLVPCAFFLFSQVKQQLKGKQFQDVEGARAFFEGVISDIPQSTWSGTMCRWFERMSKRMQAGLGVGVGVLRKTGLGD